MNGVDRTDGATGSTALIGLAARQRPWRWAFGLAGVPPALTASFVLLSGLDDGPLDGLAAAVFQVFWFVWLISSVAAAASAGLFPGLLRGLAATAVVWGSLTFVVYWAAAPACGLSMGGAPHGAAASLLMATDLVCSDGAPSRWNNAGWFVFGGIVCTGLTLVGGLIGSVVRAGAPARGA